MPHGTATGILRHLTRTDPTSDRELLARFAAARDDAAFAELVRRHGPLVLSVCRRGTCNHHDADDAFQAVFLTLARRAAAIQNPDLLGGWLYQVAVRVAWRSRRNATRRQRYEVLAAEVPEPVTPEPREPCDLGSVLDEELARLPAWHREALVLCGLQGLARADAAARLGIPLGTLASRLDKARKKLAARLERLGVTLSAAAVPAVLADTYAAVPASLLDRTCGSVAGHVPGAVLRLAQGGVKMRTATVMWLLTTSFALVGIGLATRPGGGQTPVAPPPRPVAGPEVPPKEVVLRAWDESVAGLKSGVGEGVYEVLRPGEKHARFRAKVVHSGSKFRVELNLLDTNMTDPWARWPTLVHIYDGRTLGYCGGRSGRDGATFVSTPPGDVFRNVNSMFQLNPARLAPVDLPAFVRNRPGLVFARATDGVTATDRDFEAAGVALTLRFPRATGYNPALCEVRRAGKGYNEVKSAVWDRSNGVWYVKQVERTSEPGNLVWGHSEKLTYTRFEANVEVDPSRFRLPALGLVKGVRLSYRDAAGGVEVYTYTPPAEDRPGDTLLDGLRRFPRRDLANPDG
ncbi:RNA polymerase sigma factor [bacterium]|nr:RNA polymerase sigma factor [bacterium]